MNAPMVALLIAAFPQVPDTSTYADRATEMLIAQAVGRHAYQDSLVRDYTATVRTRIDVGFGRSRFARVPPVAAHETAARVTWGLPNDLKVDILGERGVSVFDNDEAEMDAAFDRPWFIPRSLGDSIRMLDDDLPSTAALHPLAPGAQHFYRYAIVDSLTLVIPGRTVSAVGVRVEPKTLGPSLIAGDLWFDQESLEVVRMSFVFLGRYTWGAPDGETPEDSAQAARENVWAQRIVKLEADLEYALYDRLYWMPYRQLIQLSVDFPWLLNLKIPVRFITTFDEYRVNTSVKPSFEVALDSMWAEDDEHEDPDRRRRNRRSGRTRCLEQQGDNECSDETGYFRVGEAENGGRWEVHYPAKDSLRAFDWESELALELSPEDEKRIRETIAGLGELQEQLPGDWVGRMRHNVAIESFADVYRFNRVQGSSLGMGYAFRPGLAFTTLQVTGRYGFADKRATGSLVWRRDAPAGRFDLTMYREVRQVEPWTAGLGFGNSLNGIFAGHDDADYYLGLGGGFSYYPYSGGFFRDAEFSLRFERQRSMRVTASSGLNDRLGGNGVFQPNPAITEGDYILGGLARKVRLGRSEFRHGADAMIGDGVATGRAWASAALPFRFLRRGATLSLRTGGVLGDDVNQMLFRVGGLRTVRGYEYNTRMGKTFWSAQLDYSLRPGGMVVPVVFADAGDVFDNGDPLVSVGGGLSILQGWMRFNIAKGLNPSEGLRFDLIFQAPR